MELVKEREIIVSDKVVKSEIAHPDENIRDKYWIAELFIKEFDDAFILFDDLAPKDVYKISINGEIYNFNFDTTDSGGKDNSRKVSIPFASRKFKQSIEEGENVYVVNLYRPLISEGVVDETKRVWIVIDPMEIYSSDVVKKGTFNDSSRWFLTRDILELIKNGETISNKKENVFAALNNSIEKLILDNKIRSRYYLMNEISESAKNYIAGDENKNIISKIRGDFRKLLLNYGINNQIDSVIKNESLLVASHIHSVEDIKREKGLTLEQKLEQIGDPNNGLLIPVGLDKLFDRHLITFTDDWELIISKEVTEEEVAELTGRGLHGKWIENKNNESIFYLQKHREKAFRIRDYEYLDK